MENSIDAFEISLVSGKPLEIYPRKENSLSPIEGREREREKGGASLLEGFTFMEMAGPACKYLATTVRTPINFQPVFNFAKTEHRPRIDSLDNSSFPTSANTFASRAPPQRGEVACSRNYEVSCVICIRLERSRIANNCNFHPPNGGEDGKLWIRVVGSLQVFESFRKVSILRIAKIILRNWYCNFVDLYKVILNQVLERFIRSLKVKLCLIIIIYICGIDRIRASSFCVFTDWLIGHRGSFVYR